MTTLPSGDDAVLPAWLRAIADTATREGAEALRPFAVPNGAAARASAVLILLGETEGRADVLLTERATGLRRHAGQVSFPGGVADPGDVCPAGTALREGAEETGLDPAGVDVLAELPVLWIRNTNYAVTPVLAWWREPSPVAVVDVLEVAGVHRVALDDLLDPANRLTYRHSSGFTGPAFHVGGLFVWGFTALVLDRLLAVSGLERPWDPSRVEALPDGP